MTKENKSGNGRQIELDVAKGIGIVLVVWAHANAPGSQFINQFHMPFFFFISGILYINKGRSIKEYSIAKCKNLLAPFWWWNIIFFPVFYILYYWKNWSLGVAIKQILEIIFTVNKVPFLGATWFLPALFWTSIIVHILVTLLGNSKRSDMLLFVIGVFTCVIGLQITLPYRISRTFICFLYYISGYLFQKYIRNSINFIIKTVLSISSFFVFIIIGIS